MYDDYAPIWWAMMHPKSCSPMFHIVVQKNPSESKLDGGDHYTDQYWHVV